MRPRIESSDRHELIVGSGDVLGNHGFSPDDISLRERIRDRRSRGDHGVAGHTLQQHLDRDRRQDNGIELFGRTVQF